MSARVVYVHPLSCAEHAAVGRREGVRGVCLLKLTNASLGRLGAPSLLVRLSLRFREKTLKPINLTGKQIDPGVADAVVCVYGFGDVLCDRLSGTKGKLRGKRVGYLDAVRVVDSVAVGIPRQSTVSVRGVSHCRPLMAPEARVPACPCLVRASRLRGSPPGNRQMRYLRRTTARLERHRPGQRLETPEYMHQRGLYLEVSRQSRGRFQSSFVSSISSASSSSSSYVQ